MDEDASVAGRACGDCTVCCTVLQIDQPGFVKRAGDTCAHCVAGAGCAIYESRFAVCRDWFCGFRLFPWIDGDARPDLCGFVVCHDENAALRGGVAGATLNFIVLSLDTLASPVFHDALLTSMAHGFRTSFVMPAGPGEIPRLQSIDDLLAGVPAERRAAQLRRDLGKLQRAFRLMQAAGFTLGVQRAAEPETTEPR